MERLSPLLYGVLVALWAVTGCHEGSGMVDAALDPTGGRASQTQTGFRAAAAVVLPLTVFSEPAAPGAPPCIHLFAALRDAYGCYLKAPGTWRVELYEYVPRSGQTRGRRLCVWPDIDLKDPAENQGYWRDYLRCYEFRLDLRPELDPRGKAVLEATFLTDDERRLTARYLLGGES